MTYISIKIGEGGWGRNIELSVEVGHGSKKG